MSPSVRSSRATCGGDPVVGQTPAARSGGRRSAPAAGVGVAPASCGSPGSGRPPTAGAPRPAARGQPAIVRVLGEAAQRAMVVGARARAHQARAGRRPSSEADAARRAVSNVAARRCASSSRSTGSKRCSSMRRDQLRRPARRPPPVVPKVPSFMCRPARPAICAISAGVSGRRRAAVELAQRGEGDVVDVHVEAHADRVGRDQVVDLAGLVHRDLGVAGARAERAQHHRGAAALAPHQLGDGVDLVGREGDDGAARGSRVSLLRAGVGQRREARPRDELDARHQPRGSAARMVSAPRNMVSRLPRACSSRSVKTWPRSGSAHSWISSTARNSTSRSSRHRLRRCRRNSAASGGTIFSSPVTSATARRP